MRTRLRIGLVVAVLLQCALVSGQGIEWTARFDDVGADNDDSAEGVIGPNGEIEVLANRNHGTVLFSISPDRLVVTQTLYGESDSVRPGTLTTGPDGTTYVAAMHRSTGVRDDTLVLLRRLPGSTQWLRSEYFTGDEWSGVSPLQVDSAGNVYAVGRLWVEGVNAQYLAVLSFTSDGDLRWAIQDEDTIIRDYARLAVDPADNVFVVASARGPNGPNDADLLTRSYAPDGTLRWERRFSLDPNETLSACHQPSVVLTTDGIYALARMSSNGVPSRTAILRYGVNGDLVWQAGIVVNASHRQAAFNPADGGLYISGVIPGSPPQTLIFAARVTGDGQVAFSQTLPAEPFTTTNGISLVVTADGLAYYGAVTNRSGSRLRTVQVQPDGTINWDRTYASPGADPALSPVSCFFDSDGVYTAVASINDPHTSADVAIVSIDQDGEVLHTQVLDSDARSQETYCYGSLSDLGGSLYVLLSSSQYPDVGTCVLVKYDSNGVEEWRRRVLEDGSYPCCMVMGPYDDPIVVGSISEDEPGLADGGIIVISYAEQGYERWRYRYDGPTGEWTYALDASINEQGDLYVTGVTYVGSQGLTLLLKFDFFGRFQWDTLAVDSYRPVVADAEGNVYLPAEGALLLSKYSPQGTIVWRRGYNECWSLMDLAVDPLGNIVGAGRGCFNSPDRRLAVIKVDPQGNVLWTAEANDAPIGAMARRVVVDPQGGIFVAGSESQTGGDLITARFSSQGDVIWVAQHSTMGDSSWALAVDRDWVYVAGRRLIATGDTDAVVLRYDRDDGRLAWKAEYTEPHPGEDRAQALALDFEGRLCVSGPSRSVDNNNDVVTICYGAASPPCGGTPACRAADVNADCVVDLADLFIVLSNFGLAHRGSISPADGDMNFDGVTDINDLVSVLGAFGLVCE